MSVLYIWKLEKLKAVRRKHATKGPNRTEIGLMFLESDRFQTTIFQILSVILLFKLSKIYTA